MKLLIFKIILILGLTLSIEHCYAQARDTCFLETEKIHWVIESIPDTICFEEAVYDSVLCSYYVVAIDTNPNGCKDDSRKFNLIHVTDRTNLFMFSIVTFCEDIPDCSTPIQIGKWYDLRLRSVGDNDLFWRTNYLDRPFEVTINDKNVFIYSRTLKYRVVTTDYIKDLFYIGP